jgi:uncharacterized RDD family membrane protein YckC
LSGLECAKLYDNCHFAIFALTAHSSAVRMSRPASAIEKLDTIHRVTTPEGVELTLSLAGPLSRARAYLIDFLIRGAILFALSMVLGVFGKMGVGLFLIAWFLIDWFYPVFCEVVYRGSSPGKRAVKIRVVRDNGTPVTLNESLLRNLLRAVDALPFMYLFGFISMLLNRQFKRLGDMAAGTIVVYEPEATDHRLVAQIQPSAPGVVLKLHEQQAIIDFASRAGSITPERAEEIAALVAPHLEVRNNTGTGYPSAERTIAVANFLLGATIEPPKPAAQTTPVRETLL